MFDCQRCGFSTNLKATLKTHLQKKKICNPVLNDIPRQQLLNELPNLGKQITENSISCTKCGKIFKHKSNMYVHRKSCNIPTVTDLVQELTELRNRVKELESTTMKPTDTISNSTINGNVNITTNNITNNTNITLVPFNNCRLNIYGKEERKTIDPEQFYRLAKSDPLDGIGAFLQCKYFNPDLPENHVLAVSQKKLNNNEVYVWDNKWTLRNASEIADHIGYGGADYTDVTITIFDPKDYSHVIGIDRANEIIEKNRNRYGRDFTKSEQIDILNYIKNNSPVDVCKLRV